MERFLGRQVREQRLEPFGVDSLLGNQLLGQGFEAVPMGREDVRGAFVCSINERPDLFIDLASDFIGIVTLLADLAAEEHEFVSLAE